MIDKQLLKKIFKYNNIHYYNNKMYGYIEINVTNKKIVIFNNQSYFLIISTLEMKCSKRKNCWVEKFYVETPHIYFHEDYIRSIIRQKILNTLLND